MALGVGWIRRKRRAKDVFQCVAYAAEQGVGQGDGKCRVWGRRLSRIQF